MLIGPPCPAREVAMSRMVESGVPAGKREGSRGSARLQGTAQAPFTGLWMMLGGKLVSCGAVLVEWRCLKALMVATGSSWRMAITSLPGIDPRLVTATQGTEAPAPKIFTASSCMLSQVSGEA